MKPGFFAAALVAGTALAAMPEAEVERRVQDLIGRMTLQEKVGQLNLLGCSVIGAFELDRKALDKMYAEKKITKREYEHLISGKSLLREEPAIAAGNAGAVATRRWEHYNAAQKVAEECLSVRQTEQLGKRLAAKSRKPALRIQPDVDYLEPIENELTAALGRKVRFVKGNKVGKVEIEYYNAEDLDRLIQALQTIQISTEVDKMVDK